MKVKFVWSIAFDCEFIPVT